MMIDETDASQGAPEGETVAPPEDISATGTEETATTEDQPAEQPEQPEPEPEEPKRRPWFMDRIDRQGQRIAELQRQNEELSRARQEPGKEQPPKGDDVDAKVNAALAQRELQERVNRFDATGRKEFPDFLDRCATIANCGANDRPEFIQLVSEMDDGHKLVAHLADHPDEAVRILSLTPARMALELGRLSAKGVSAKAAPKSSAPPPIKPIAGGDAGKSDDAKLSDNEWYAKWLKENGPKG